MMDKKFHQLNEEEQQYVLEIIQLTHHWNAYLRLKIQEELKEVFRELGLFGEMCICLEARRYSYVEGEYFQGEVPVCVEMQLFALKEKEKQKILNLVLEGQPSLKKIKAEEIDFIEVNGYGDNIFASVSCPDAKKAFLSPDYSQKNLRAEIESYFSGLISSIEARLTLFSKSLREKQEIENYIKSYNIVFDENCLPNYLARK